MRRVPRPRIELDDDARREVRDAWETYRRASADAERARRRLIAVLRRLQRRGYSVRVIARGAEVSPMSVWSKLRPPSTGS